MEGSGRPLFERSGRESQPKDSHGSSSDLIELSGSNHAVVPQSRTNEPCIEFEKGMPALHLGQAYMGTRGRLNGLPMRPSWKPRGAFLGALAAARIS